MNLLQDASKPVQMMKQTNSFNFMSLEDVQAKILEIPYKGSELSMMVLLPDEVDGLQEVKPGACGASCCCLHCWRHSACAGCSQKQCSQNAGDVPGEQNTGVCHFFSVESNGKS
jgi:hypothetical protein